MTSRAIAAGAFRMALYVALAKVLIAAREIVFAAHYGVGPIMDAYNVAITVITWLPMLMAGAAGSAIVPALIRADRLKSGGRDVFTSELNGSAVLLAGALTAIGVAVGLGVPELLALNSVSADLATHISLLMAPFAGLTVIFYYLSIRLQAQGKFAYSVVEALPALTVVTAVAMFHYRWPISVLVVGTLIGGIMQIAVLVLMIRSGGARAGSIRFSRRNPEWTGVAAAIGSMTVGQALLSVSLPLDQYVALSIGPGAASTLGYALRLVGLGTSIGTLVLARTLLPTFATLARDDPSEGRRQARLWSLAAFAVGVAGLVMGWIFAEPVTRLAFERGEFDMGDSLAVSRLIQLGLLQLPFYFGGVVAVQWLAVCGRYSAIAWIAGATIGTKGLVFLALAPLSNADIMLSTAIMYAVAWAAQTWMMLNNSPSPGTRPIEAG